MLDKRKSRVTSSDMKHLRSLEGKQKRQNKKVSFKMDAIAENIQKNGMFT